MIKDLPKRFQKKSLDDIIGYEKLIEFCRGFNAGQSIIFSGDVGRGKTHFATATARQMHYIKIPEFVRRAVFTAIPDNRQPRCLYLPTIGFLMQCNDLATNGNKKQYLDELIMEPKYAWTGGTYDITRITGYDLIIMDDFGAERLTDASRQNLFYLINGRYENCLSMIITTNLSMQNIHQNEPRIASRFSEMGKIFELNGNDYRI